AVLKDKLQKLLMNNPFRSTNSGAGLSPDAQEKLRALGYLTLRSPETRNPNVTELADPKDKIFAFNTILDAQDEFRGGNFDRGRQILSRLSPAEAGMYIVPFMLGEAALREEKWQEAADQSSQCLELKPTFEEAMTGLSRAFFRLRQL